MPPNSPKEVARRFIERVGNAGDLDAADELVHSDYTVPGVGRGSEAAQSNVAAFRAAFPDLERTIEEMVAEGDRVAMRTPLRGTHRGAFRGIAPTDKRVTM